MHDWIRPCWPAPDHVHALITTRQGGCSDAPYHSLNLAAHVGDDPQRVACNRERLVRKLGLPAAPFWLEQVHGCDLVECDPAQQGARADAATTTRPGQVCAVLTADCLPLLLCNRTGTRVAAVHAGWRGLAAGVLERAVEAFDPAAGELLVWLGPAIGAAAFEVGDDVRQVFLARDPANEAAFVPGASGRWLADIYRLARIILAAYNPGFVGGGDYCTVSDSARFFSYRRDGVTGRMASLIWIGPSR